MRTILTRLAEMLLLCFTLSTISCALLYYEWIPVTESAYGITLLIVAIIFIVCNVFMLRQCYFDLRDPRMYYILNFAAYGIFMLITAVVYKGFGRVVFSWMFNALKLLTYTDFDLSAVHSTAVMHAIMLVVIAIAPIGMEWIFDIPDEVFEDEDEEENEEGEDETDEDETDEDADDYEDERMYPAFLSGIIEKVSNMMNRKK